MLNVGDDSLRSLQHSKSSWLTPLIPFDTAPVRFHLQRYQQVSVFAAMRGAHIDRYRLTLLTYINIQYEQPLLPLENPVLAPIY